MSAFLLGKVHIDALLTAALGPGSRDDALYWYTKEGGGRRVDHDAVDSVGAMLVTENVRSLRARYPDIPDDLDGAPGPIDNAFAVEAVNGKYHFARTQDFEVGEILAAITCYEYQTCEHDEWEGSDAEAFCKYLREAMCRKVPGYEGAWEIEDRGNPLISLFEMSRNTAGGSK